MIGELTSEDQTAQASSQPIANPSLMHPQKESPAEPSTFAVADPSVFVKPEINVSNISAARLDANRANAKLSHGPLSPETKAISSQNHTIHGLARHQNRTFKLLATEDPIAFEALKQSLFDEHLPESILVNSMAESNWLSARAQRLQDTCLNPETREISDANKFSLYLRYQTTHTRAFHKSVRDLAKLRNDKRKAELGVEAQRRKEEEQKAKNERCIAQTANLEARSSDDAARALAFTLQLVKLGWIRSDCLATGNADCRCLRKLC